MSPSEDNRGKKGFTLLELLIVIGIIVILSAIVVLVLNPAETLRKSRDAQRISDLATMKGALGLYLTSEKTPKLDNTAGNTTCENGSGVDTIYYSLPSDAPGGDITDATLDGGAASVPDAGQVTNANKGKVNGSGWIKVDLTSLSGGAPISNLPIDPTNTVTDLANVDYDDLVYRYMCDSTDLTFELNAKLESTAYTSSDNRLTLDGGDNDSLYEVGTKLSIMGTQAGDANEH
ncbi:prepilin-type N-terminal cleavage/methylation domain-containing protein [Candidatus Uhrbacteria bacterium]|nr:prepilin-type N-terminal cleavage/methylation domain-containing protein [Candidatus Uhrbacteria bacterium]